jgi:hypothetical protein
MAPVCEEEQPGNVELELEVPEETEGVGMALRDSDSEPEESDKHEFITDAMGWNVSSVVLVKLTARSRALHEKLIVAWLLKKCSALISLSCSQNLVTRHCFVSS